MSFLVHEYSRIIFCVESFPPQHNRTHPFLNFTHKHPHKPTFKPTTQMLKNKHVIKCKLKVISKLNLAFLDMLHTSLLVYLCVSMSQFHFCHHFFL
jgi:hypothetical protein